MRHALVPQAGEIRVSGPDPKLAKVKYERAVRGYDRRTRGGERYRRRAIARLELEPGQTVLDVACGTGVNFTHLLGRVGPVGRVVGIDLSTDMLEVARRRIENAGWKNVELVEATIEDAELPDPIDAALFSLTHDVMRSDRAIHNVVSALAPGARVASFGACWAPRWRLPVNAAVWLIARRYVTTFEGFDRPWALLEQRLPELHVEPVALGGAYVAWGRTSDGSAGSS